MKRRLQNWVPGAALVTLLSCATNAVEASEVARQFSSGSTSQHPVLLAIGHIVFIIIGVGLAVTLLSPFICPRSDR